MTEDAQKRVVLVTGASAGIGLETARLLARSGWTVVGASRRGTGDAAPGPSSWRTVSMDVDDDDSVTAGVAAVLEEHRRIDAVVACAGYGLAGPVETTPLEEAKDQLETNFFGAVRVVKAALEPMRQAGRGRVVLVSSLGGVIGIPFQAFYSASKFALEGFGEALAYEVAPFGIEVTLVQPGNIATDFTKSRRQVTDAGAYGPAMAKAIGVMERDEASGAPAERVASVIRRVLEHPRPPRRVSAGKLDERAGTFAKRLLPYRLFERAAKPSLGV